MKEFDDLYTLDKSVTSKNYPDEFGKLETYDEDIKKVLEIADKTPKRVWTMIDGDDGIYIVAGYHLVNRICYFITNEEWKSEDEEYLEMENTEVCPICDAEERSENFFWRDGPTDTDNQFKVSEYLTKKNMDYCCEDCFKEVVEGKV